MRTLYLDIFSGISGDMFIGAMLDLGVDPNELGDELGKLGMDEFAINVSDQQRGAIAGTKFDVNLGEPACPHGCEHDHEHGEHDHHHGEGEHHDHLAGESHGPHGGPLVETAAGRVELSVFESGVLPRFRLYFFDEHGHAAKPLPAARVTLETVREGRKKQSFKFKVAGEYLEATTELPEPHEFQAVLNLKQGDKNRHYKVEFVEDHHHHSHEHAHEHGGEEHSHEHTHEHGHEHHHHGEENHSHEHGRTYPEIRTLIQRSDLSPWVKQKAVAVFDRVAQAEGHIHGMPPEEVHFHEVGAVDSIVDIVGACICLELLGKPRVLAANPVEGTGTIRCAHGTFPIPAPATLEILRARGVTLRQCEEPGELITPTGAAILAEFVETFGGMPALTIEKIGYGLGTRENKTRPNVLRAIIGKAGTAPAANDWESDSICVLETNLDDINAEVLGAFVEKSLAAGALDVFQTPVQMKKNRPGVLLTVLCAEADADKFAELMLRETTAFGVRRTTAERRKLRREVVTVTTDYGKVEVKLGRLNGGVIQASPEFESCRRLAEQRNVPVRTVYDAARKALKL